MVYKMMKSLPEATTATALLAKSDTVGVRRTTAMNEIVLGLAVSAGAVWVKAVDTSMHLMT